jgi:hypothetical protein
MYVYLNAYDVPETVLCNLFPENSSPKIILREKFTSNSSPNGNLQQTIHSHNQFTRRKNYNRDQFDASNSIKQNHHKQFPPMNSLNNSLRSLYRKQFTTV